MATASPTNRALSAGSGKCGAMKISEPVRNGFQSVRQEVRAGEDGEDAGRCERLRRVDSRDARMRVRRAHHSGVGLTGEVDVVAEASTAGEQARVLLTEDRHPDSCAHDGFVVI